MEHRIIVVDDEIDFLQSIRRGLVAAGFKNVITESDPFQALERLENGHGYDLAIVDIGLPDMSGYDVASKLRSDLGIQPKPKLIALTGHGRPDDSHLHRRWRSDRQHGR